MSDTVRAGKGEREERGNGGGNHGWEGWRAEGGDGYEGQRGGLIAGKSVRPRERERAHACMRQGPWQHEKAYKWPSRIPRTPGRVLHQEREQSCLTLVHRRPASTTQGLAQHDFLVRLLHSLARRSATLHRVRPSLDRQMREGPRMVVLVARDGE